MAYVASDGSKHTNKETMNRSNASFAAKQPTSPPAGDDEQGEGETKMHDDAKMEELGQRFEQFMQEMASGQPPDPQNCQALAQAFASFVQEEEQEQY